MFRDKRVRNMAFFTPTFMIIMFLFLFGYLQTTLSKPENYKVHVVGDTKIVQPLLGKMQVIGIPSVAVGKQMIQRGEARVVLEAPDKLPTADSFHPVTLAAYYDPKQDISKATLEQIEKAVTDANGQTLQQVFKQRGISADLVEPLKVTEQEVIVGGKGGAGQMVIQLLPYLIIIWAFYGGLSVASELVAGEKDKNTLETLLISPVTRTEIATGKFLSLATLCLISSASSFIGLFIIEKLHLSITSALFPNGLGVSATSGLLILSVLLPTVGMFASVLLALSTYARNPREAQSYSTAVSFLVLMPAMSSQFIGFTEFASSKWLYFIPVLNSATVVRDVLQDKPNAFGIFATVGLSLVMSVILIAVAIRMFNREQVLMRV